MRGVTSFCCAGLLRYLDGQTSNVSRYFYALSYRMKTPINERITENIVRDILDDLGYRNDENITIEEQKSNNPRIQKCLQSASKSGKGVGKPEFIITSNKESDILIVVECKADIRFHESANKDQYKDYSVDGVLNYAAHLSKEYNVIAIAISGQTPKELKISTFLWAKNDSTKYNELLDSKTRNPVKRIIKFDQYVKNVIHDPKVEKNRFESLITFSKTLHNDIRDYGKISEANKPLLVSGILLALMNNAFAKSYKELDQEKELPNALTDAIKRQIAATEMPDWKMNVMTQPYSFISVHPELKKTNHSINQTPLHKGAFIL
jgi:type I restriction enzyme M protein